MIARRSAMLLRALVVSSLIACGGGSSAVDENVMHEQLVDGFPDLETCREMTEGQLFNCTRTLTLCTNGGFMLVVTDIINEGLYADEDGVIVARVQSPGDVPDEVTFRRTAEGLESPELGGERAWTPNATTSEELESTCASIEGRTWWPG